MISYICPHCGSDDTKFANSYFILANDTHWDEHECINCGGRFKVFYKLIFDRTEKM